MTPQPWEEELEAVRIAGPGHAPTGDATLLPDEFWDARPTFGHIRQAARARLVSPDAVLGAVLARVALLTDHRILLPPIVGRHGSLNLVVMLVAPSGMGKGSSLDVGDELLESAREATPDYRTQVVSAGSGEGVVRTFSELVTVDDDPKGKKKEWARSVEGVLIRVDEAEMLSKLGARTGATLLPILRQGWSGETIGFNNASQDRRYPAVAAHTYRLAVVMAIQPELAGDVLRDQAGGTPQRVVWLSVRDPAVPDTEPAWPGPLNWKPLRWNWPDSAVTDVLRGRRRLMHVAEPIQHELRDAHRAKLRDAAPAGVDSHRGLNKLKVAALLALLDGRGDVGPDDWQLAELVLATSDSVREHTRALLAAADNREEELRNERAARRAHAEETARAGVGPALESAVTSIVRVVEKNGERGTAKRQINQTLGGRRRQYQDTATAVALDRNLIVELGGRYYPSTETA